MGPQKSLKLIKQAMAEGYDVRGIFLRRARFIQLQHVAGSSPSVRSGFRHCQNFSILVLDNKPNVTVPPGVTNHVLCWASSIASLGTACNYLGYVKLFYESRSMNMD